MRKDVKTGMLIGVGLVFVGWVLFALFSDSLQERRQKQLLNEPAPAKPAVPDTPPPVQNPPVQPVPQAAKPAPPVPDTSEIHTVASRETLISISILYYGKGDQWPKIMEANQETLQSPAQLRPGMRLKIPKPQSR